MAQNTSRDNYTGSWETSTSWNPSWVSPSTTNLDDITIYGNITRNGSLAFKANKVLTVFDTLIVNGNLDLGNGADLIVKTGAVIIIRGDLKTVNKVDLGISSYLVVLGNFTHTSSGSKIDMTTLSPSNVFLGGTYPALSEFNTQTIFDAGSYSTGKNFGVVVDLINTPIYGLVNAGCTPIPSYYTNGEPMASPNPISLGSTVSLTVNPNPGSGASSVIYKWTGPSGFSYSSATTAGTTRGSVTNVMEGYYKFTITNSKACSKTDSAYLLVDPCSSGMQIFSRDNFTGTWNNAVSWSKNDNSFTLPPSSNPLPSPIIGINGYITLTGDLRAAGSQQIVCDTLVVTGNFYADNPTLTVMPNGVLIVLGDYIGVSGTLNVNNLGGRVVIGGDFTKNGSNTITVSGSGALYVLDPTPTYPAWEDPKKYDNNTDTLQSKDAALWAFYSTVACGTGISAGTIGSAQIICSGTDVAAFTSVADASPGSGFSYQWFYSTASASGPWTSISGATTNVYNEGSLTASRWYYRRAQKGAGCTANSNVIAVTVNSIPTANAGSAQSICGITATVISGASSTNGTISWTVLSGLGAITNGTTISPTYTPVAGDLETTVSLRLSVSSAGCTTATSDKNLPVYSVPITGAINHD